MLFVRLGIPSAFLHLSFYPEKALDAHDVPSGAH